jgi:hypothetical protein
MAETDYREYSPGRSWIKQLYVRIILFIFGRAFQAGYKSDRDIKAEFDALPADFIFDLCVMPSGPHMLVGKVKNGGVKYMGSKARPGIKPMLVMKVKNTGSAFRMFTFFESTAIANARNRLVVEGELKFAMAMVRVMNLLEVYLLPKPVAKLGVKRYPPWSQLGPLRKYCGRFMLYLRLITG